MSFGFGLNFGFQGRSTVAAPHIYTGTLLPATETDRLKDSGKVKDPLELSSGAAISIGVGQDTTITLSATSQYSAIIKNGTFTETLTADQTAISLTSGNTYSYMLATQEVPTTEQRAFIAAYPERTFAHFNANDAHTESVLAGLTCNLLANHSVGGSVVDYSKAVGGNIFASILNKDASLTLTPITGGYNISTASASASAYVELNSSVPTAATETFEVSFVATVVSGSAIINQYYNGSTVITIPEVTVVNGLNKIVISGRPVSKPTFYFKQSTVFSIDFTSWGVKEITTHPITNYATACDLKQQSIGVQLISFQKSGGVIGSYSPLAMWFDGLGYVGAVATNVTLPSDSDFAVGFIMEFNNDGTYKTSGSVGGAEWWLGQASGKRARAIIYNVSIYGPILTSGFHFLAATVIGTTATFYVDGVNVGSATVSRTVLTRTFKIGAINGSERARNMNVPATDYRFWLNDQYAKFDPAKAYNQAQKIIAQLEAL